MAEHSDLIEAVIVPRIRDLGGGFMVRRTLPHAERRRVGPFVFWDQMGPAVLAPGQGLDVRPHPHIGLATLTYLFEGEILHRDSLGTVQPILPGAVNWMTAGRGIVHSERTPPELRRYGSTLFGIQAWVGLPEAAEECEPAFVHHGELPEIGGAGWQVRVIAGHFLGVRSPVRTASETLCVDVRLDDGATLPLPPDWPERAAYVVSGALAVGGQTCAAGTLVVFRPDCEVRLAAVAGPARLMILGGAPLSERDVWWNFVSSSPERMERAKADWRAGRFPPVPGEREFIPLPEEDRPEPVRYP